jgi:ATP-binding cassette, subfamily B, bacterial PglK
MIASIYKLLNFREKYHFKYIFILLCINSLLELMSLAIFYPLIKFLTDGNYGMATINNYLIKFDYQIINTNEVIFFFLGLILIMFVIKNSFYLYYVYEQTKFVKKIRLRVSNELLEKYIHLSYPAFFKKTLANILRNIDLSINFSQIALSLILFYSEILVSLVLIGYLLNLEFKLTLAIIVILTVLILISKKISKNKFYQLGIISQKYAERLRKEVLQTFSGIREVKILKKESFFIKKFNNVNRLEAKNNLLRDVLLQVPKALIETVVVFLLVIIIFSMYIFEYPKSVIMLYVPLMVIASLRLMPSAIRIIASLQRLKYNQPLNQILIKEFNAKDESTKNEDKNHSQKSLLFQSNITISDVSFFYKKKSLILKNLNLKIEKNSCIGIVGTSGSGKSTLTDLIIGLLKPTTGSIKVDGYPLNDKIDSWKNKISYVSQLPFFLNDTIEKNIAFGLSENKIDRKLITEVSKKSKIYDDIKKLKLKFQTKVGESGINFSGGQLQRIAIARALYKKSEVLILDESTNSLDDQNESQFFSFLKSLKKRLTIIIISHKKENLLICDSVYEIKNKKLEKIRIY